MMVTIFESDINGTQVTTHKYPHRGPIYTISLSVGSGNNMTFQFESLTKLQAWIGTVYNGVAAIVDEATGNVPPTVE